MMLQVRHIAVALRRQGSSLRKTRPSSPRETISFKTRHYIRLGYLQYEECTKIPPGEHPLALTSLDLLLTCCNVSVKGRQDSFLEFCNQVCPGSSVVLSDWPPKFHAAIPLSYIEVCFDFVENGRTDLKQSRSCCSCIGPYNEDN